MMRGSYGVPKTMGVEREEVILVRIYRGVKDHLNIRWSEWLMLYPTFGMWIALNLDPHMFDKSASFAYLRTYFDEGTWALILGFAGLVRVFALLINGTFKGFGISPHLRALAALIGVAIWSRYSMGLVLAAVHSDGALSGVVAWSPMVIIEVINLHRALTDARSAPR